MTVQQLIDELRKLHPWKKIYITSNGRAVPMKVTWSAVDPSLDIPETYLLMEDTDGEEKTS